MRLSRLALGLSFVVFACKAELPTRACTELACLAGATVTAKVAEADAAAGTHTFDMEVDGSKARCVVIVAVGAQSPADAKCEADLSLSLGPVMDVRTVPASSGSGPDAPVAAMFAPAPGQFEWRLTVPGSRRDLKVTHTFGDRTVSARTIPLVYRETHPNGPGCEPACQVAKVDLPLK
jgi:hypothetical protein